jgi:glycosyltransferase involved in cell wall biosynthesis
MHHPLVSIITVALNAEAYIGQTIQSVLAQTWRPVEYIIVDGGSTDGTLSVINRNRDRIDHVISEKDEGIADAMNKGLALATGDYVIFLQADDYFKDRESLAQAMLFVDNADLIACNIEFGREHQVIKPRGFNFWFNFKGIPHQGVLCRRTLLNELRGFDQRFGICMDYDFLLRAFRRGARLVKTPVVLTVMRDTGVSSRKDWKGLKKRFDEERRAHEKNCPSGLMGLIYRLYWLFYPLYRRKRYLMEKGGGD